MAEEEYGSGWIQWKGTSVCMDIHCLCGELTHVDDEFLYYVRCGKCGRLYEVEGWVDLKAIDRLPADTSFTEDSVTRST